MNRPKFLDQRMVEFSGLSQGSGLLLLHFSLESNVKANLLPEIPERLANNAIVTTCQITRQNFSHVDMGHVLG